MEEMAEICHDIWSHWMRHFLVDKAWKQHGMLLGQWGFADDDAERWSIKASTSYDQLSEKEKQSDRDIAYRYLEKYLK